MIAEILCGKVEYDEKAIAESSHYLFAHKDIIKDMLAGLTEDEKMNVTCIEDRKEAILEACNTAEKGDVVLIAGKGHETYQEIKGVKHHFDDKEIILS